MTKRKDDIDRFYEYDIELSSRLLYMGSAGEDAYGEETGTDYRMAERMVKGLAVLDMQAPNGDKPITIIMNNPGGDYYNGLAIYDAIDTCRNFVRVLVYGRAQSMGTIILQAADERILSPRSSFMIHYGQCGSGMQHSKDFIKWADEEKRNIAEMENIYLERIREKHPKFSRKKLEQLMMFDKFMTAEEATDLGLATKVMDIG